MTKKRLPYREGDWVLVPLEGGLRAVGRLARVAPHGGLLAYFFGPPVRTAPTTTELETLTSGQAALVCILGDLGLLREEWRTLGQGDSWHPEQWPIPAFGREEGLTGRLLRVSYCEDLVTEQECRKVSEAEFRSLPQDGVFGYKLVEALLASRLGLS